MKNSQEIINKLIFLCQFRSASVDIDEENRKIMLRIDDEVINTKNMPIIINAFSQVFKLIAKKYDEGPVVVDINNYYKDKEKLVIELAKAGAKKAVITKNDVILPPMNAFERHLVHEELSVRPDVKTESIGAGTSRRVVVKFIE